MSTNNQTVHRAKKRKPVPARLDIRPMGTSARIHEFIMLAYGCEGVNFLGTSDFSPILVHVYEQDGFLHLLLGINDHTTAEDLRGAAPLVVALRDRLLEFQGPDTYQGSRTALYKDLSELNENNTLPALTKAVNELIAEHLAHWHQFLSEFEHADCNTPEEWLSWLTEKPRYVYALTEAEKLLRHLNMPGIRTDAEIHDFCRTALQGIHRGEDAYSAVGQPLDESQLREKLRYHRKSKLGRSLKKH